MPNGLLEIGEIMLSVSQQRLNAVSENVANATTPGFKASEPFAALLTAGASAPALSQHINPAQGALRATGRNLDLAIAGEGFFRVSGGGEALYTRAGAFERDEDGRLVDAQGRALQSSEGGDVIVSSSEVEILTDGIVLDGGAPITRIGVFQADWSAVSARGGYFAIDDGAVRAASAVAATRARGDLRQHRQHQHPRL
jgi:flagellar basal-body rod protein FlgF